jgi:energy-converting hydrogenase Eha subunit E
VLDEIVFLVLAAITVFGALKVVSEDEPVHAAIFLGLVLLGVAGIYLTLSAEFLAAIQILIYVGAVTTLILFAVMLTTHASPMEGFAEDRAPLAALGVDAPKGMDVEEVEEVPEGVETVEEAEREADREGSGHTIKKEGAEPEADDEADTDEDDETGGRA